MNKEVFGARARVAALTKSRKSDDPELAIAKSELRAIVVTERIKELSKNPPPLTDRQREVILSAFAGFTPVGGGFNE